MYIYIYTHIHKYCMFNGHSSLYALYNTYVIYYTIVHDIIIHNIWLYIVHTYIYIYIYIHAYIRTYIHTYIHMHIDDVAAASVSYRTAIVWYIRE